MRANTFKTNDMRNIETRNIETQVVALIASKFKVDEKRVTAVAKLEDLGADSLALVELLLLLEDRFQIDIPDEEALDMVTFQDVIDYVEWATSATERSPTRRRPDLQL
jgi:acyl carrier protein